MKKLLILTIAITFVAGQVFAQDAKATAQEVVKITNLVNGAPYTWTALSGTKRLGEVQFLETIGNSEYLEQARAHEVKFRADSSNSSIIFLSSVGIGATGLTLGFVGLTTKSPGLLYTGLGLGAVAIVGNMWSAMAKPQQQNYLAADQAQVLADGYNAKR